MHMVWTEVAMQEYDIPSVEVTSHPAANVFHAKPNKKGKGLRFALWQSCTLVLLAYTLTYLRYRGLLDPLVTAVRARLGL